MEAGLVKRAGIPFKEIPAAGLHGVNPFRLPANILSILKGIKKARLILEEFKPDAMFFTGGFVAFPMAFAGRNIPSLLYVPDVEPGMALKALARFAKKITLTSEESLQFFSDPSKLVVTGYPVRPELSQWDSKSARAHFHIPEGKKVLLVFGGSKGSRSINRALTYHLRELLTSMEVIHITGELDWNEVEQFYITLPVNLRDGYHAFPYLHEDMGAALSAADLVVSRAGASALGEFPHYGLPAILVPYPYAWRYQKVNADTLVSKGAAEILEDNLLIQALGITVKNMFNSVGKIPLMKKAMTKLNRPDAAQKIAEILYNLPGGTL
jgi:UDP-N-acetylglucosamine--N-acetylmuramyl-(pentapeptide) pyrophosphoryl-undecaprenol N-acetylglucosamine transferase